MVAPTYGLTPLRRGIICGYKVIISVITSEMVTNELLSHGEVLVNGDAVRARQVANQIALRDVWSEQETCFGSLTIKNRLFNCI